MIKHNPFNFFYQGDFLDFFSFLCTLFNTALSAALQIQLCVRDAGIEPRTFATSELALRPQNHSEGLIQ